MKFWYRLFYTILFPLQKLIYPCRVSGRENIPEGAAIVCANHTSLIDPVLLGFAFGHKRQLFFMAKAELFDIPVVGALLRMIGVFPVSRGETDIVSIRTTMKHLKNGEKVMMFPEGTRVAAEETVEAKTGAVRIAAKMKVPIVPVFLTGNRKVFHVSKLVIGKLFFIEPPKDKNYEPMVKLLMDNIFTLEPKQ